ncbi:MAG: IS607 family transposase [Parachlamydiales bacterium]|nr:IS607 family transposase [Parachlamydiales bacterium]
MSRFIKIGKAAKILGVSVQTLRRWEEIGYLVPDRKSTGDTRYYNLDKLMDKKVLESDLTIGYARVSSHDQKEDLKRQAEALSTYCIKQGWNFEILQDLGSGMNYQKKGLKTLLDAIVEKKISRLVLTHKDRLLRFGAELIFALCEKRQIEIVIINKGDDVSFEEELAQDVLEIITVFSARLYGSRSRKNKKLIEAAKVLISDDK